MWCENLNGVFARAVVPLLLGFMLATFSGIASAAPRKLQLQGAKQGEQQRYALVIGNAKYESPEIPVLANPANDAHAMAETLRKLNFHVIEVINANQKNMKIALADFGEKLAEEGSVALFYYAGHGLQVKGKNYLVPVDADITRESAVAANTVDLDDVLNDIGQSKVSIVILDACRNNPFKKARSIGNGGLAQITTAPAGSYIAYSTAPGRTAADGTGKHGLYTQELLQSIMKPGLTIEDVFKNVRLNVMKATSDEQTPWENSSLTGSFYFNGAPSSDLELAFWGKIKDSESIASYDTYLTQYPNGKHVKEAEQARERLLRKAQVEQAKREEEANRLALEKEEMRRRQEEDARTLAEEREKMRREGVRRPAEPPPYVPPAF